MYTGELNLSNTLDAAQKPAARSNIAIGDGGEPSFALLFEAAMEISAVDENQVGSCSSGSDFDLDSNGLFDSQDSSGLGTMNYGSIMSRLLPNSAQTQLTGLTEGRQSGSLLNSGMTLGSAIGARQTSMGSLASGGGVIDKNELSEWMDAHALTRSTHHCAMYCRMGLEAAGLSTADRPASGDAGDYGPFLLKHGAQTVPQEGYVPQVGDVVVFSKTSQHPYGHIEMYDGHNWVSDFMQHSFSPYRDAGSAPPYTIYRLS
jgi:hypothetical protein